MTIRAVAPDFQAETRAGGALLHCNQTCRANPSKNCSRDAFRAKPGPPNGCRPASRPKQRPTRLVGTEFSQIDAGCIGQACTRRSRHPARAGTRPESNACDLNRLSACARRARDKHCRSLREAAAATSAVEDDKVFRCRGDRARIVFTYSHPPESKASIPSLLPEGPPGDRGHPG